MLTMVEKIMQLIYDMIAAADGVGSMLSLSFLCKRQSYRGKSKLKSLLFESFVVKYRSVYFLMVNSVLVLNVPFPSMMVPIRNGSFHLAPSVHAKLQHNKRNKYRCCYQQEATYWMFSNMELCK